MTRTATALATVAACLLLVFGGLRCQSPVRWEPDEPLPCSVEPRSAHAYDLPNIPPRPMRRSLMPGWRAFAVVNGGERFEIRSVPFESNGAVHLYEPDGTNHFIYGGTVHVTLEPMAEKQK